MGKWKESALARYVPADHWRVQNSTEENARMDLDPDPVSEKIMPNFIIIDFK